MLVSLVRVYAWKGFPMLCCALQRFAISIACPSGRWWSHAGWSNTRNRKKVKTGSTFFLLEIRRMSKNHPFQKLTLTLPRRLFSSMIFLLDFGVKLFWREYQMKCLPIVFCIAALVSTGVRSALSVLRDYYVARFAVGGGSKAVVWSNVSDSFRDCL